MHMHAEQLYYFCNDYILLKRLDFKAIRFHLPGGSTDRSLGDGGGGGGRVGGGGVGGCGGGGRGCCKGALGTSPPPPTPPPPSRSSLPPISPKSLFCQTTNPPAHNAASSTSCRRSERLISILLSYRDRCGYVYKSHKMHIGSTRGKISSYEYTKKYCKVITTEGGTALFTLP